MKCRTIHIDLFSGAGGFHEGLIRAGFKFTHHYFSEIDKHAIANYRYNYKDAEYIGSVTNVRHIIRTVDRKPEDRVILTFGSPCQDFSLAGKREGLEGSKSSLIKFALVLIRWIRPDVYIWENVKGAYSSNGGADYWAIIQAFANIDGYRFEQQLLNTSWVLPQNRERIYLVGHLRDRSKPGIFPITENDFRTNERAVETSIVGTLSAGGNSCGLHSQMTLIKTNTSKAFNDTQNDIKVIGILKGENGHQVQNVYDPNGIAPSVMEMHGNVTKVIQLNPNIESGGKQPYQQNRIYSDEGVTPALNAGKSDLIVKCGNDTLQLSEINIRFDDKYGCKEKTNSRSLLSKLQSEIGEKKITEWGFRIFNSLQEAEILRQKMYVGGLHKKGKEIRCRECHSSLSFEKIQERLLREMWGKKEFGCSPYRWKLAKQYFREFANSMQKLSYKRTSSKKEMSSMRFGLLFDGLLYETLSKMEKIRESNDDKNQPIYTSNIRRLTEIEVEILQGFCPDHTKFGIYETKNGLEIKNIPKTQRYKLMGNAVTCDIVQLIGERIELL